MVYMYAEEGVEKWLYDSSIYSKYCVIRHYVTLLEDLGIDVYMHTKHIQVITGLGSVTSGET